MSKALIAALISGATAVGTANAAHISFAEYAETQGEKAVADGFSENFNGVDITFSTTDGDPNQYFVYFDDDFEGRPGGLGLCQTLAPGSSSACDDTTEDNIRAGSDVLMTFSSAQSLSGLSFTDKEHFDLNGNDTNTFLISLNGGAFAPMTFADAVAATFTGVTSIGFGFDPANGVQYYVNSLQTPLPAAAPLLLAGLAGLGFASRRRSRGVA